MARYGTLLAVALGIALAVFAVTCLSGYYRDGVIVVATAIAAGAIGGSVGRAITRARLRAELHALRHEVTRARTRNLLGQRPDGA